MIKRVMISIVSAVVLAAGLVIYQPNHASAAWNANNIIDDQVFDSSATMSAISIQGFLNGFANSCLKNYQAPYPNGYDSYGGNVSAATVIRRAADIYGVNPQVILATLEKEESLVSGSAGCPEWRYNSAMGMGCPDGGACPAPGYEGFSKQVTKGTWLLKFAKERSNGNVNWEANDGVGGDREVSYSGPMTQGCKQRKYNSPVVCFDGYWTIDNTTIHIDTGATGSFYNYTPHFAGNQNFVSIFENWFGSTRVASYQWQFAGQTSSKNLGSLAVGETATLTISAKNVGSATWQKTGPNPMKLGTANPNDRGSQFAVANNWLWYNRPAGLNETSVAPGETGTFTFNIVAPNAPGNYKEYFNLVVEGITWLNDLGQHFPITVVAQTYSGNVTANNMPSSMVTDSTASATVSVQNTGTATWYKNGSYPVRLGTYSPPDRASEFYASGWLSSNRVAGLNETSVAPGETGTFTVPLKAPHTPGNRTESFSLVAEGLTWFNQAITKTINVQGTYTTNVESQAAYTDNSKSTPLDLGNLSPGQTAWLVVQARNTGTATWQKTGANPVNLGTEGPRDRFSRYYTAGGWLSPNRAANLTESSIAPDAVGSFEFPITVPAGGGTFTEKFRVVSEGLTWMDGTAPSFTTTTKDGYQLAFVTQYAYTDASKTTPVDVNNLSPGQTFLFGIKVRNTGTATWFKNGNYQARLGTSRPRDHISSFFHGSWLSQNRIVGMGESSVAPNQEATFEAIYTAPSSAGSYKEYIQPVIDGITWLNDWGIYIPANVN